MSKTRWCVRIAGMIVVVWLVIATGMISRFYDAYGLYLATCDCADVSVCVPATGDHSERKIVQPAEIQEIRWLIGARRGRLLTEFDRMVLDLPGCHGHLPKIELTLWRNSYRLASMKLEEGGLLRVTNFVSGERPYYLDSDAAYRKLCDDAGVKVPWEDYGM